MSDNADKSLLERVSFPSIPDEAQKKIAYLQEEFLRSEVDQMRRSIPVKAPLFEKRNEIINIPEVKADFWIRVFSSAPAEIDEYILPSDAGVLGESLKGFTVERFEINEKGEGEPRSLRFIFEFDENNSFFEDKKLVKEFYWRQQVTKTASGKSKLWEGLVSEPVRINWKKDKDVTKGLLDATCDLFDAEKKGGERIKLPEYEKLIQKIDVAEAEAEGLEEDEELDQSPYGISFFNFFGYRGRDVTAEQSKEAEKFGEERWAKIQKGEPVDDDEEDDEDDELTNDLESAEAFPDCEDVAIALAEDLWDDAMKYYVQSFELGDLEDLDFDEMEDIEEEDEDEESHPRKKARGGN
ncbi:hypothetical protein N7495_001138 [Penicillium taxi]|uniref:uncharacterized protein n=1 Tax=Penicillium taxi TaxID=168475 RepID=UPI002545BABE|nr:uncharacterized protein N7495_001138 [Penicillium taxi]KAJ5908456.1 hypothetical protein N7495_001138 [Penicillium taxi]